MNGSQAISFSSFGLTSYTLTQIKVLDDPDFIEGITPIVVNPENQSQGSVKSNVIYDLSGRRVSAPSKGIYIIGGRKVVVK